MLLVSCTGFNQSIRTWERSCEIHRPFTTLLALSHHLNPHLLIHAIALRPSH
jgi:hypothetical protein